MAIQVNGNTVIDNTQNITNVNSYSGDGVATQQEAEDGTNNDQLMTPLRVLQSIEANGGMIKTITRGSTSFNGFNLSIDIPISQSFDMSKTMINQSVRSNVNGYVYFPTYDASDYSSGQSNGSASIRIVNSTTLTLSTGIEDLETDTQGNQTSWANNSGIVDWELIEYK